MAAVSITYTFINGQTSDGPQVSQNFTDIINGLSDGTKDLTVAALSGSTLTLSGNVLSDLTVARSNSGGSVTLLTSNTSNTASSNAIIEAKVAGTSANDPFMKFTITGGTSWAIGADNSSSDNFVIGAAATLGATDYFKILAASGNTSMGPALDFVVSARTATLTASSSGNPATLLLDNTVDAASSDCLEHLRIAGTSGGDPYRRFTITGGTTWSDGVDNSDSDAWKVCENQTLDTTNDHLKVAAGGVVTIGKSGFTGNHRINVGTQTTVGAAGAGDALPATPQGYMVINVAGTNRAIPFYLAS